MGSVAGAAVGAGDGEPLMTRLEAPGAIVAGGAQGLSRLGQQGLPGRAVRGVAGDTRLARRWVGHCSGELRPGVAGGTELSLRSVEQRRVRRAVGVVAARAALDAGMPVSLFEAQLASGVAVQAQRRLLLLEAQGAHQPMGPVAGCTVTSQEGSVDDLGPPPHVGVALRAGALAGKPRTPFELAAGDGRKRQSHRQGAPEGTPPEGGSPHGSSSSSRVPVTPNCPSSSRSISISERLRSLSR
jgi:hypothetical protein